MRTAGDRTRRRRLNKLSCADWLPHDRGFVSGLPRSKWRASVWGPAHNRAGGFPTAALSPAMRTIGGLARVVLSFLFKSVVSVVWPCGVVGDAQRRPSAAANPQGFAAGVSILALRHGLAECSGPRPLVGRGGRSPK